MSPMICQKCGGKPSHFNEDYQYLESGLNNVMVRGVDIFRCHCGEEYVQLPGMIEVHDEIADSLLKKPSLLTGQEVKFLRKWLRLTSEQLAALLGITRASVSRAENTEPTASRDRMIRLLAAGMKGIQLDTQQLLVAIKKRPDRDFLIIVDLQPQPMRVESDLTSVLRARRITADIDFARDTPTFRIQEFDKEANQGMVKPEKWSDELAMVA